MTNLFDKLDKISFEKKRKLALSAAITQFLLCAGKWIAACVEGKRLFIEIQMIMHNPTCYNQFILSRYGILMTICVAFEIWGAVALFQSTKKPLIESNSTDCYYKIMFWRGLTIFFFGFEYFYFLLLGAAAVAHNKFYEKYSLPFVLVMILLWIKDGVLLVLVNPWFNHFDRIVNPPTEEDKESTTELLAHKSIKSLDDGAAKEDGDA